MTVYPSDDSPQATAKVPAPWAHKQVYPSDDSPQATARCVDRQIAEQCIRATIPRKPQRFFSTGS